MLKCATVASVVSLIAVTALATPTSAATFTPDSPPFVTITGTLLIEQSTPVQCDVTLNGYVATGGSYIYVTSGSFMPGDWQCGWLVQPTSFPWTIMPNDPSYAPPTAYIIGMGLNTILGNCSGSWMKVNWSNGSPWPSTVEFPWMASIPGSPSYCTISGKLTVSNGGITPITIVP